MLTEPYFEITASHVPHVGGGVAVDSCRSSADIPLKMKPISSPELCTKSLRFRIFLHPTRRKL